MRSAMESDPSSVENFPFISGIFSKTTCIKSEIPTMVPVKSSSTLSLDPPHDTSFFYQNNYHHSQNYPLNEGNHQPRFVMEGPSSIGPFDTIPTPPLSNSYRSADTIGSTTVLLNACYPMGVSTNGDKIETLSSYLSNGNNYLDFDNKNPHHYGSIFQSQVGSSLSPLLDYDTHASMQPKPKLQDDPSCIIGIRKNSQFTDLKLNVGDQRKQKIVQRKNKAIHHIDANITKGQWTVDEDRTLIELVDHYGLKKWAKISKLMNGRIGKQCRERWNNHLQSNIKKGSWSKEEEKILIEAHKQIGNKWVEIAKRLPGRTENTIKNHWNATKRKQNTHDGVSTGTLLQKYIKEVTNAKVDAYEMKSSMRMMNTESTQDHNNKSYHGFSGHWATQENEVSCHVPMMFNSEQMVIGSSTMDYDVEMEMV